MTNGPDFYDQEDVFRTYTQRRQRGDNPNDTIEAPIFMEMLGDFRNKTILDLGCGDGGFGVELLAGGCRSYTGIEASARMVASSQALQSAGGEIYHAAVESFVYPHETFDVVVSRLALHYVAEILPLFQHIHQALRPNGRLIFSVEHPVLTSSNHSATATGTRYDWTVDHYFVTGARNVTWMGSEVVKYHRTVEDYFSSLQQSGFGVEQLRESRPRPEMFADAALFERRQRIPLFLFLAARKN